MVDDSDGDEASKRETQNEDSSGEMSGAEDQSQNSGVDDGSAAGGVESGHGSVNQQVTEPDNLATSESDTECDDQNQQTQGNDLSDTTLSNNNSDAREGDQATTTKPKESREATGPVSNNSRDSQREKSNDEPLADNKTAPEHSSNADESGSGDASNTDPTPEDLTPNEVTVDCPDEYDFQYVDSDYFPPDVQYTPEYDDDWIYATGAKSGGSRDDVSIQGIELGVVTTADQLELTVKALLSGLSTYYEHTDQYPRHRFVCDADAFDSLVEDDVGLLATFQPRPDGSSDLIEHMQAMQTGSGDEVINPNTETAEVLTAHLIKALGEHGIDMDAGTFNEQADWRQIAETVVFERYAPLAAEGLYDPIGGEVDLNDPDVETVADLSFKPTYIDAERVTSVSKALEFNSETAIRSNGSQQGQDGPVQGDDEPPSNSPSSKEIDDLEHRNSDTTVEPDHQDSSKENDTPVEATDTPGTK